MLPRLLGALTVTDDVVLFVLSSRQFLPAATPGSGAAHTQARSRVEGRAQDPGRSAHSSKAGTYPKLSKVRVATKRSIDMRHSPAKSGKAWLVRLGHDLGVRPHIAKIIKAVIFPHQPRIPVAQHRPERVSSFMINAAGGVGQLATG